MKLNDPRISAVAIAGILIIIGYHVISNPYSENSGDDSLENGSFSLPPSSYQRSTRAGTPWPMHLKDPAHIGYTTDVGPIVGDILWSNVTNGPTYSSPVVVDGKVFIGGQNKMCAFYAENGTLAWETPTYDPVPGGEGFSSTPAVDNGYVFYGGDGFYCLWENNGTVKWFVDTPWMNWGDGTPTVANGKVFIAGSDWYLYCIDQETGTIIWSFQTSSAGDNNWGLYAAPAVVDGWVYLAACDGYLYKINEIQPLKIAVADTSFYMNYASYTAPVVVNNRVYVGTGYEDQLRSINRFFCLNATDLTPIWEFYPGSPTSFFSSGAYYDGRIYVGSRDGNLYCLDAMDNDPSPTIFWQYSLGETWSTPAITDERLYMGSKEGYLYCFNISQPVIPEYYWRTDCGSGVDTSPAVVNGRIYVGSHLAGGTVYCIGGLTPPPSPPGPPTDLDILLTGGGANVMLTWTASADDGGGDNDVTGYSVYRSSSGVNGVYNFAAWIEVNGSTSFFWNDVGAGDGNPNDYFYIVRANDTEMLEEQNENKVGKVVYSLNLGWNLISIPLIQSNTSREVAFQTLSPNYMAVQAYHAGKSTPWLHWHTDKSMSFNDVFEINRKESYYVYMLTADELVVVGKVPSSTSIPLKAGWNLLGYPYLESRTRDTQLSSIMGLFNKVEMYNSTIGRYESLDTNDPMHPGLGYWIHVTADCDLNII